MSGEVKGAERLAQRLAAIGAARGQERVVEAAGEIAAEAAALAPGRLGEALEVAQTPGGAEVAAPGHARFAEFGTRRQAAQPFLRPAIERARAGGGKP